jgi:hypothetical protein
MLPIEGEREPVTNQSYYREYFSTGPFKDIFSPEELGALSEFEGLNVDAYEASQEGDGQRILGIALRQAEIQELPAYKLAREKRIEIEGKDIRLVFRPDENE